jgi:ribonuclease P protein component
VLPRYARLTSPNDFARTTKSGFRVSSKFLVVYLNQTMTNIPAQAGLIISKSVGGSVARHKVARQVRHALRTHLIALPAGTHIVVRALTGSAGQELSKDLDALIPKAIDKAMALK